MDKLEPSRKPRGCWVHFIRLFTHTWHVVVVASSHADLCQVAGATSPQIQLTLAFGMQVIATDYDIFSIGSESVAICLTSFY